MSANHNLSSFYYLHTTNILPLLIAIHVFGAFDAMTAKWGIKKRISLQTRRLLGHLTLSSGSYLPNQWRQHSEVSDRDYYMPTIPEAIFLDDPVPSVFALGYGPWLHIQIRSEFLGFVTRLRG